MTGQGGWASLPRPRPLPPLQKPQKPVTSEELAGLQAFACASSEPGLPAIQMLSPLPLGFQGSLSQEEERPPLLWGEQPKDWHWDLGGMVGEGSGPPISAPLQVAGPLPPCKEQPLKYPSLQPPPEGDVGLCMVSAWSVQQPLATESPESEGVGGRDTQGLPGGGQEAPTPLPKSSSYGT